MTSIPCPLCCSVETEFYTNSMNRDYHFCNTCKLIFVPKVFFLDKKEEKKRYDFHENSINDSSYVAFLSQFYNPLIKKIKHGSKGLDFGSGPEPVLSQIMKSKGFKMEIFDPFYAKDQAVLNETYDFITLTEVAEHFHNPAHEFDRLIPLLKHNGYLAIMTYRTDTVVDFKNWHYQKDETHVCFYADESMNYIAKKYKLSIEFISKKVVLFQKND